METVQAQAAVTYLQPIITVIVGCIAAGTTVLGWYRLNSFSRERDDRTRQIERHLKQLDRQSEELYGPLYCLIQQIFNVWTVKQKLLAGVPSNQRDAVDRFIWQEYFQPLHTEMREVLKSKLYLIYGDTVPRSFLAYLEHSTHELFAYRLASQLNISATGHVAAWPTQFNVDVENGIKRILQDRNSALNDLQSTATFHPALLSQMFRGWPAQQSRSMR